MSPELSLKHEVVLNHDPAIAAADVIAKAGISKPPVTFDRILPQWGRLALVEADLEKDGYLLRFPDGSGEIVYARRGIATRRWRFTVAHELGHWITELHSENGPLSSFRPASFDEVEHWCDEFAKHLLMPVRWVSHYLTGPEGIRAAISGGPDFFDVSRQAFEGRLVESFNVLPVHIDGRGSARVPPIVGVHRKAIEEQISRESDRNAKAEPIAIQVAGRKYTAYLMEDAP